MSFSDSFCLLLFLPNPAPARVSLHILNKAASLIRPKKTELEAKEQSVLQWTVTVKTLPMTAEFHFPITMADSN